MVHGAPWSRYPLQPVEVPHQSRSVFSEGMATFGELVLKQRIFLTGLQPMVSQCWSKGKCESSGREEPLCTDLNSPSHFPHRTAHSSRKSGVKLSLEKGEGKVLFNVSICFSQPKYFF